MSSKRPGKNNDKTERARLVAEARQHLRDARNEANSPTTRYAAACEALLCCYRAGLLSSTNRKTAFHYGRYRRDVGAEDSGHQVVVAWLERLLK